MKVGEQCVRDVVTVRPSASLREAATLMREKHVGFIVVVDESDPWRRVPVGVLTDRDIVIQVFAPGADAGALSVADVMTRYPVLAHEHEDVSRVLVKMREVGIRRAPVVDASGALMGVIAMDDAIQLVTGLLCDISGVIRQERRVEGRLHASTISHH